MVNIYDLMDAEEMVRMVKEGYVRVQRHPVYPYNIACYTKQAMFERVWNDVTMNCRGLIYHQETGEVIARPFKKFFNYGEPSAPLFKPDDWVTVYDKVDGSLGIAYDTPDGPAIATKGSFASEQAVKATEFLRTMYPRYQTDDYCTDLFEIIYPENRIVLDYGTREGLMYLGSVVVETGENYWNGILMGCYGIPKNHCMDSGYWSEIENTISLDRRNAEGVVVLNDFTGERLKMKQEDYIELHKVMTGLNERQIWEWMRDKKWIDDILLDLPEEMHEWAKKTFSDILTEYQTILDRVSMAYCDLIWVKDDRKAFAKGAQAYDPLTKALLFLELDNARDRMYELIWKAVRP